jgi:cell division protein FtsN
VGDFDSVEEAEGVRALLTEAGFAASVEKRDEADDEGKIWSTVKVDPERREEAMEFLAERLGLE